MPVSATAARAIRPPPARGGPAPLDAASAAAAGRPNGTDETRPLLVARGVRARAAFLRALRKTFSVSTAARAAGISRATAYRWRAADADFAQAWDEAVESGLDDLEGEAYRRAMHSSERLLIFMLERR